MANQSTLARCPSAAANLPPEILKMIFNLTADPPTDLSSARALRRQAQAQPSVCSGWSHVPDGLGAYVVAGPAQLRRLYEALLTEPERREQVRSLWVTLDGEAWRGTRPARLGNELAGLLWLCPKLKHLMLDLTPSGGGKAVEWLKMDALATAVEQCGVLTRLELHQYTSLTTGSFVQILAGLPNLRTLEAGSLHLSGRLASQLALSRLPTQLNGLFLNLKNLAAGHIASRLFHSSRATLRQVVVTTHSQEVPPDFVLSAVVPLLPRLTQLELLDTSYYPFPYMLVLLDFLPRPTTIAVSANDVETAAVQPALTSGPGSLERIVIRFSKVHSGSRPAPAHILSILRWYPGIQRVQVQYPTAGSVPWTPTERDALVAAAAAKGVALTVIAKDAYRIGLGLEA